MKRVSLFLYSFALLLLVSCGADLTSPKSTSGQNTLNGAQCGCTASYMPVCGVNNITYDNSCIASCYQVTQTTQGNCICSERPVCGDDGATYTECEAQAAIRNGTIKKIVKFVDCSAASY